MKSVTKRDFKLIVDNENPAEGLYNTEKPGSKEELQRWPICGLPVGSFLQVIEMDQQTCILEVYQSADCQGHFVLVQGSLYDAVCNGLDGEEAALEIFSWENVRLNIKQIVRASGFERKIDKSLMSILMEYSRRHDEARERQDTPEAAGPKAGECEREEEKFKKCLSMLRDDMGDALIAAGIADLHNGKALASYQDGKTPDAAQLFMKLTGFIQRAFEKDPKHNQLGGHYILNLRDEQTLVVLLFKECQLGIIFNHAQCSLGLVLKIIIPKVSRTFDEANL